MRKRQLYRTTLRFRKWSRKAYAAFASLGRCVTIGCLPKSVADSSLSKQKSGTSAGCKSGRQSLEDTDNSKGQETDIGIPLGNENGLGTKLEIFGFRGLMPVLCPATIGPKGKKYVNPPYLKTRQGLDINTIINKSGTHVTRIDPGNEKTGIAIVSPSGEMICRKIISSNTFNKDIERILTEYYGIVHIVCGNGTNHKHLYPSLQQIDF